MLLKRLREKSELVTAKKQLSTANAQARERRQLPYGRRQDAHDAEVREVEASERGVLAAASCKCAVVCRVAGRSSAPAARVAPAAVQRPAVEAAQRCTGGVGPRAREICSFCMPRARLQKAQTQAQQGTQRARTRSDSSSAVLTEARKPPLIPLKLRESAPASRSHPLCHPPRTLVGSSISPEARIAHFVDDWN